MINEFDDIFEKDDLIDDIISIDLDDINIKAIEDAKSVVENLSKFYYDESFIKNNPNIKKRIDSELESLRVLIKMRKADEEVHDALVKAIAGNSSNASLYSSLSKIQNTMLSITTKINDIVVGLNNLLKGFQLELPFDQDDDEETETTQTSKTTHRGSKEFIKQMIEGDSRDDEDPEETDE